MPAKILLADDSLTIQKVIKITLNNEPYELDICNQEQGLEEQLKSSSYPLVLLDFNFSDAVDGYELTKKIKSLSPSCKVLMLFGTFDTIDETLLQEAGVDEKIVKPFDSNMFIAHCRKLVGSVETISEQEESPTSSAPEESDEVSEDEWVVTSHSEMSADTTEKLSPVLEGSEDALKMEASSWGIEVPETIDGADAGALETPDRIENPSAPAKAAATSSESYEDIKKRMMAQEETNEDYFDSDDFDEGLSAEEEPSSNEEESQEKGETSLPSQDDLEYPDMGGAAPIQAEEGVSEGTEEKKPRLMSMEDLSPEEEGDEDFSEVTEDTASKDLHLEEQVYDDELSEDFWAIDDPEPTRDSIKISDMDLDDDPDFDDEDILETPESDPMSSSAAKKLEEDLKAQLAPIVEKVVREFCKETVEKVAWEVMPDLAENLIKQELNKIAEAVIKE